MTKVLVTGAHGLLGSTLVPHLRSCGHEVVSCSRTGADVCADLTDPAQAMGALSRVQPDVIVNLAAATDVDECERDPQLAYRVNGRIVENLTKWMQQGGSPSHLVQISTDQVYDGVGPHDESDVRLPNYYAFSKYVGELAAGGVPSTVLRTNLFGPSRCPGRASLSDWLIRSLDEGAEIVVYDDVQFSPLSLRRLVGLVEVVVAQRRQGVFNLGSSQGMSKADFAFAVADALGLPTRTMRRGASTTAERTAYRPKDMRMDSSHFQDVFGVSLPSLEEEVRSLQEGHA